MAKEDQNVVTVVTTDPLGSMEATFSNQACAHLPSSPNLSNYSLLLDNIQNFIRLKKTKRIGQILSSTTMPVFSHWVWAFWLNKGQNVDNNHAEDLLLRTGFDKNMLKAVF